MDYQLERKKLLASLRAEFALHQRIEKLEFEHTIIKQRLAEFDSDLINGQLQTVQVNDNA